MFEYENLSQYFVSKNSCNFCNGNDHSEWGSRGILKLVKCEMCGLVYINPRLNVAGLNKFNTENNKIRVNDIKNLKMREEMFRLERDYLLKHIKTHKSILDIGCGGGGFLQSFSDQYNKIGTEYDPVIVRETEKKGIKCYSGDFLELKFTETSFDVIILRGVIEHVLDPKGTLEKASDMLVKKGLMYITSTPNLSSVCAEVYRGNWNMVGPDHLYYFDESSLSGILNHKSMRLIAEHHFYEETPYANNSTNFKKLKADLMKLSNGQKILDTSPPYWGNMLTLIYEKF